MNKWKCERNPRVTAELVGLQFDVTAPAGDRLRFVHYPFDRACEPISFELERIGNQWLLSSDGFGGNVRGHSGEAQQLVKEHGPPWLDCPELLFPAGAIVEIRQPIRCTVKVLSAVADGRDLIVTVSPGEGVEFEWSPKGCGWSFKR